MTLYKYAEGSSGAMILDGLRLKVTPPNELNDPFELTPCSRNSMSRKYILNKAKNDPEHFRQVFDDLREREGYEGTFPEFIQQLRIGIPKYYSNFLRLFNEGLIETDFKTIHDASNHLLLLCLSAVNDSIPMWSHYANHHRGIAIGLDPGAHCFNFGTKICKVKYSAKRVGVDWLTAPTGNDLNQKIEEIVSTKSRNWEYEKEYRICFPLRDVINLPRGDGGFTYLVDISPTTIREIIFGCCITSADEALIRGLLALKRFRHVRMFRASRHTKQFKIDIVAT